MVEDDKLFRGAGIGNWAVLAGFGANKRGSYCEGVCAGLEVGSDPAVDEGLGYGKDEDGGCWVVGNCQPDPLLKSGPV